MLNSIIFTFTCIAANPLDWSTTPSVLRHEIPVYVFIYFSPMPSVVISSCVYIYLNKMDKAEHNVMQASILCCNVNMRRWFLTISGRLLT